MKVAVAQGATKEVVKSENLRGVCSGSDDVTPAKIHRVKQKRALRR